MKVTDYKNTPAYYNEDKNMTHWPNRITYVCKMFLWYKTFLAMFL